MSTSIKYLALDDFSQDDMENLVRVVCQDPEMDPRYVHDKLLLGQMIPLRIEGKRGPSIVVMEIKQKKTEKILYIWYLSGSGLTGNWNYLKDTVTEFAKINDCQAIEALTDLRLAKYFSRPEGGFKIKHAFVRKEI